MMKLIKILLIKKLKSNDDTNRNHRYHLQLRPCQALELFHVLLWNPLKVCIYITFSDENGKKNKKKKTQELGRAHN